MKIIYYYYSNNRKKLLKFCIVGMMTYLLNNLLFYLFNSILSIQYQASLSLAYFPTVICHFLIHKFITFEDKNAKKIPVNIIKYLIMLFINFIVSLFVVTTCVEIIGVSPYWGLLVSTIFTAIISFTTMNHFVFKRAGV
jgi:putative flippase GtrA